MFAVLLSATVIIFLIFSQTSTQLNIVCTLSTNDDTAHGVIALRQTVPLSYQLVVLTDYGMSKRTTEMISHLYRTTLVYIDIGNFIRLPTESTSYLSSKGVRFTWYKLCAWNITELEGVPVSKLLFIDADTLITDPTVVDELFTMPTNAFAFDTIPPGTLNTGIMLISPSSSVFQYLVDNAEVSCDESDQGYINTVNTNAPSIIQWNTKLNMSYNAFAWIKQHHSSVWKCYEPVKIVHFNTLSDKPYGSEARVMADLDRNTAFSHTHSETIGLWKAWRDNYCRGMMLVAPAVHRVYMEGFC